MSALMYKTTYWDPPWLERGSGRIKRGAQKQYSLMKTDKIIETIQMCEHFERIEDNAHCYCWVTNNFLEHGLRVMRACDFRYVTNIAWPKFKATLAFACEGCGSFGNVREGDVSSTERICNRCKRAFTVIRYQQVWHPQSGIGQYFRGSHELLLFGVRGKGFEVKTAARDIVSVQEEISCIAHPRVTHEGTNKPKHSAKPDVFRALIESRSNGPYLELFARGEARESWTSWGAEAA